MFLKDFLNKEFIEPMIFDLQKITAGYFGWNQTYLVYNEGYLSLGFTLDFTNSTFFNDPKPPKKTTHHSLMEEHSTAIAYEIDDLPAGEGDRSYREGSEGFLKAARERWFEAGGVRFLVNDKDEDIGSAFLNIE
jgi:hypothetical protein